jgi:hypothetical protein
MLQHVSILIDDLKKDPASIDDDLSYHYQFDQNGDLLKIPHQPIIRETIEEMPRLTRLSRKPDAILEMDSHTKIIDLPMIEHEASPEADIQNLYDDFVGQINSGLASVEDIKEYPLLLLELYQLIKTQIYAPDRPRILKKLKEMIGQLDNLYVQLSRNPSAQYTISPIRLTDQFKGLYPEEKKSYTQKITKSKKQKLIRLGNEDLPIMQRDVVDFFEQIQPSSDYEIGKSKSDIVSKVLKGKQQKSKLVDEMNTIFRDYAASQIPAKEPEPEITMGVEEIAPMPRKRKIHKYPVEATLRPERKARKPKAKKEKDPMDISRYTISELKDFMRERKIKGLTGKKAQLVAIVKAYLEQDDEA